MTEPLHFCPTCGALQGGITRVIDGTDVVEQIKQARVDDETLVLLGILHRASDEIEKLRAIAKDAGVREASDAALDDLLKRLQASSQVMLSPAIGLLLQEAATWLKALRKILELKGLVI